MARSKDPFARNSPLPSTHQKITGGSESVLSSSRNAHSIHPKIPSVGNPATSIRNDTPVLVRSTSRLFDPEEEEEEGEEEEEALKTSTSSSRKAGDCRDHNITTHNRLLYGHPRSSSRQSTVKPTQGPSSGGTNSSPPKVQRTPRSKTPRMTLSGTIPREDSSSLSIDVSQPSFERDGLGIYTTNEREEQQNDLVTSQAARKNFPPVHRRSTSGTSQFSTESCSSMSKPGPQYVHPMRQAPRGYTPPPGQSHQTSIFESDDSAKAEAEGEFLAQSGSEALHPSARASSGQTPRLSLQIQDSSFTRLPGTSQTNIAGRSSFSYSRDNGSTLDTGSPMSRPSLDFVFRSKTRTSMDPVSRAATVQAARQAFEEKEAAKAKKFEEQQMKAEQRQIKRKEKQNWRTSLRGDEAQQAMWEEAPLEKPSTQGTHATLTTPQPEPKSEPWRSQPKNTWMHFLTWLRTRIFKLRRKVKNIPG
ncbi:hypothetical protein FE257_004365 [Aspergillus nanangensis]|uniref:Uncharacterized protein n=1 Tax=Aspergillus nanangensis TaxID=2582783 RepID=A0AAD4CAQ5_ASPNN|nr:hypothetical protein FE257_004365 [Aspergillus nanangensis]